MHILDAGCGELCAGMRYIMKTENKILLDKINVLNWALKEWKYRKRGLEL